jgi:hypothetical protein
MLGKQRSEFLPQRVGHFRADHLRLMEKACRRAWSAPESQRLRKLFFQFLQARARL